MHNTISVPIENLSISSGANWIKSIEKPSSIILRIHFDQLLITSEDKVIESLNINGKLKAIYKDDILLLIVNRHEEIRKIKFKIKERVTQCLAELSARFPVVNFGSIACKRKLKLKYHSVDNALKIALEEKEINNIFTVPSQFNNLIKLCLLDPMFPQLVLKTNDVLNNEILKKR